MIAKKLTYKEIKKYTSKLAILPTGSLEQHGPYLPLGTDAITAEETALAVEKRLPNDVVVYPTIYYGCAKEHKNFPGTVYLEFETYMQLIKQVTVSIFNTGFKKVLVIGGHGGNHQILQVIQSDWNYDNPDKKLYYAFAFTDNVKDIGIKLFGHMESHAGSTETSLIYSLSEEYVKTSKKTIQNNQFLKKEGTSLSTHTSDQISSLGIITKSNVLTIDKQKGAKVFKTMVDDLVEYSRRILQNEK